MTIDAVNAHVKGGATQPPKLLRRRSGRIVAGVCGGIADHLAIPVLRVRVIFVLLVALSGAGIVAYGLLWLFVPQRPGGREVVSSRERNQAFALILVILGLAVLGSLLNGLAAWIVGPVGAALVGTAVVWREADESQRRRWREGARSGVLEALRSARGRAAAGRVLTGTVLVITGIIGFLVANVGVDSVQFSLMAVLAALLGVGVLTVPWWMRLVRDLDAERASRIRSQERAEIAAHLHDSVLQTLALIQKQAGEAREVRRLARSQERELRTWLYGPDGYGRASPSSGGLEMEESGTADDSDVGSWAAGSAGDTPVNEKLGRTLSRASGPSALVGTLAEELARICGEVEDTFAIEVQQVVVGDCRLDDRLRAQLAAAREAIVNSAKHADVSEISVYAEAEREKVAVYVRDRGQGFEPDAVPADRHGLAESIRGRMERNGGRVRLRTAPGAGTEVQLEMPRGSIDPGKSARWASRGRGSMP